MGGRKPFSISTHAPYNATPKKILKFLLIQGYSMQSEPKPLELDSKRKKLVKMLSAGLKQKDVAVATGWSEGYVSQLCSEPAVIAAVESNKLVASVRTVVVQDKYDSVETKLLDAMTTLIPVSEMRDVTRALEVISKANPRSQGAMTKAIQGSGQTVVNVELPVFIERQFNIQKNSRNEIVEIDGRDMTSITPRDFHKQLPKLRQEVADANTSR